MSRTIVISNRVAQPGKADTGGLAAALRGVVRASGGLWMGWSGRTVDGPADVQFNEVEREGIRHALLDLTADQYEGYYLGFANRTLWPLFHFQINLMAYESGEYAWYRQVNREFARHVAPLIRDDDLVWVHDYHLIPLAHELRALGVTARIGFFLHVPLPPARLLAMLPVHLELFTTFADYDLLGFQTTDDQRALTDYAAAHLDAAVDATGTIVRTDGQRTASGSFPISIDTQRIARQSAVARHSGATTRLLESLNGRHLAIGVDRLDYSKGLPERFAAFGEFMERHAQWQSRVSLLQIAPVSRGELNTYRDLRTRLERQTGAINGRYAQPDWVPIRYVNHSFRHATLTGFYRSADIGVVTPLRDGMNLVAKEFIAAQPEDNPGVLILSRFAGAARELTDALLVNPMDSAEVADAIAHALSMPHAERVARWRRMFTRLQVYDINHWQRHFLTTLAAQERSPGARESQDERHIRVAIRPVPPPSAQARRHE